MPLDTHPQLAIYAPLIEECAATYALDPVLVGAIILKESSGRADAYNSRLGASGLMQVVPREAGPVFKDRPPSAELMKPEVGIDWGCRILREYLDRREGDYYGALKLYAGYAHETDEKFTLEYWSVIQDHVAKLREGQPMATTTERFIKAAEQEFGPDGFEDLRAKLPDNPQKPYWTIDSRVMPNLVIHHSTGPINATWSGIWKDHRFTVNPKADKPWPGIGYHLGVRLGKVALLGSLDTIRAHVKGLNDKGLGICVVGDYDKRDIPPENVDALRRLIYVLDGVYGHAKTLRTHGGEAPLAMLPGYTQCPGSALKALVSAWTRERPQAAKAPQERMIAVSYEALAAALWHLEEGRREFARGQMAEADNRYRDLVEHPLKVLLGRV